MKHWITFLKGRTHTTQRLGKIASSLSFEVESKALELENAKANLERFETQICNKIAGNYSDQMEFETAISSAKHKANLWNNEPIDSHKPHTLK